MQRNIPISEARHPKQAVEWISAAVPAVYREENVLSA